MRFCIRNLGGRSLFVDPHDDHGFMDISGKGRVYVFVAWGTFSLRWPPLLSLFRGYFVAKGESTQYLQLGNTLPLLAIDGFMARSRIRSSRDVLSFMDDTKAAVGALYKPRIVVHFFVGHAVSFGVFLKHCLRLSRWHGSGRLASRLSFSVRGLK